MNRRNTRNQLNIGLDIILFTRVSQGKDKPLERLCEILCVSFVVKNCFKPGFAIFPTFRKTIK